MPQYVLCCRGVRSALIVVLTNLQESQKGKHSVLTTGSALTEAVAPGRLMTLLPPPIRALAPPFPGSKASSSAPATSRSNTLTAKACCTFLCDQIYELSWRTGDRQTNTIYFRSPFFKVGYKTSSTSYSPPPLKIPPRFR